jgi:cytochrome c biogenesis protein CcdA
LLLAYALGLGLPFLPTALFAHGRAGHLRRVNRYFGIINLGAGALLMLMGVMVYGATFVRLATLVRPAI